MTDATADRTDTLLEEITLLSLFLSSWEETGGALRAWKGHRFELLDQLEERGLVTGGKRGSKSLYLTDEGIKRARELETRYADRSGG